MNERRAVVFFQFMVDDMIFFSPFNLTDMLLKFYSDHSIYALHLKLYPGITYSHTQDKLIASIPKFQVVDSQGLKYLKYRRTETEMDWNYPFDFCGSIYRQDDLNLVIEGILESKPEERNKILKPNSFEYIGNVIVKRKMLAKD